MPANDLAVSVSDAMQTRRSVRAFTRQAVDPALLRPILTTAQRAPSGGNLQPWQATLLTGEAWQRVQDAVAARIALGGAGREPEYAIYPEGLAPPWENRRREVGEALYASLDIPRENKAGRMAQFMHNFKGFGAPVMLFLHCSRNMGPPQWSDMGMWLQSVMLLCVEAGLATCPQECWSLYGATIRREIGVGDDQILFSGLAIGYADAAHAVNIWPVPRAPLDEAVSWQGFEP